MTVQVDRCFRGQCDRGEFYFRLTLPTGEREIVYGDKWTRAIAAESLDLLEKVYGADRNRVRFQHR